MAKLASSNIFGDLTVGRDGRIHGGLIVDGDTLVVDNTNGRVGIGTDSPTEALHVAGKIRIGTQATATTDAVRADRTITAGNGLTGGGNLTANQTLTLGTPGTITNSTTNNVTADSHTHALTITAADVGLGGGTSTNISATSGATIISSISLTNGIVTAHNTRSLTAADVGAVPTGRTLTGGDGINSIGNLSSNRTISVDSTVVRTSGDQSISGTKTFIGSVLVYDDLLTSTASYVKPFPSPRSAGDTEASLGNDNVFLSDGRFLNVHARSDDSGPLTYEQAVQWAIERGGRLPTIEELEAHVVAGSGSGYDNEIVWTQTEAGRGKRYVNYGRPSNFSSAPYSSSRQILDEESTAYVRWVADDNRAGMPVTFTSDGSIYIDKDGNFGGDVSWSGSLTSGSVPWARLTSVPSTFTPSAHTHTWDNISGASRTVTGDWNDVLQTGFYQGNSLANQSPGSSWRFCIVQRHNDSWISQTMIPFGGEGIYQRNRNNGTWSSWRTVAFTDSWSVMSVAEGQTGTATTTRFINAANLKEIIEHHAGGGVEPSSNVQVNSLGVGTAASGSTGEIRATGDITSNFSDDRLKTRLGAINGALSNVLSLSAFYYEPNEVAQDLGYTDKERKIGLSAQEIQKLYPEIVKSAPIDDQYLTVQYERMVPVLVSAIQEQQALIEQQRETILGLVEKVEYLMNNR